MARKKTPAKVPALVLGAATVVASSATLADLAAAESPEQRVERLVEAIDRSTIEVLLPGQSGDGGFEKASFDKDFEKDVPV